MCTIPIASTAPRYLRWVAVIVGALLIGTLSMVTMIDGAVQPPAPTDMELTLGGITQITQVFTITQPDLVGLSIRLRPAAQSAANLRIPVHLRYADGPPVDLISASLLLQAAEDGVLTMRFPALEIVRDPRVPTTTLRLILDIPKLPRGTGPSIIVQKNLLGRGAFSVDGLTESGWDLAISPLSQHRWVDRLWPISAMARGKPGPLGWPPFYALLAYAYLIALGVGAACLRRAMRQS
ncbi:MAG: hypothetical protein WCJ55_03185 [Chloroflexales bacterium]